MELDDIKGLGPKSIELLQKLNIKTCDDLLNYYPYKYINYCIKTIDEAVVNEEIVLKGNVVSVPRLSYIKRNLNRLSFQAMINKKLITVNIFNRAFLKSSLTLNKEIIIIGKYNRDYNSIMASNISLTIFDNNKLDPQYHLVNGLKKAQIQKWIEILLKNTKNNLDNIPLYLSQKYEFISKDKALLYIHKPRYLEEVKKAKVRLIYEELFTFMFKINYLKYKKQKEESFIKRDYKNEDVEKFISSLPFKLTNDQINAIKEITDDFKIAKRMNRLVLGDVGSGKTIVAVIASYINYLSGYQTALMAPTEILAKQHYENITKLFKKFKVNVCLLTGSTLKSEKKKIYEDLNNGKVDLLIGTHAIITDEISFNNLGLVITDEQHRFGVNQRNNLQNKGLKPDVIYLSATPIPRTYALTLYGDMDISIIKEKPIGRIPVITTLKNNSEIKDVLFEMVEEIKKGHQIYVVSPLIEENDELDLTDVNKLKNSFDEAFKEKIPTSILHGKLKSQDKEKIMNDFKDNKTKILISTTVIEVGIDIKNATMMVIFNAERFGLATLHQLRGRIGRGTDESKCILISDSHAKRLDVLVQNDDGFVISEEDFKLRGEGDLFGVKQSGDMNFKVASLKNDYKILVQAKKDSDEFINNNLYQKNKIYNEIVKELDFID